MKKSYILILFFIFFQINAYGNNSFQKKMNLKSYQTKSSKSIIDLLKNYFECWDKIYLNLKKIEDNKTAREKELIIVSELGKMDAIVYALNGRTKLNPTDNIKNIEYILKENDSVFKNISTECIRLHEKNNFGHENILKILMQENRRGLFSAALDSINNKNDFLKRLNKDDFAANEKCNKYSSLLMSFEDLLRGLNENNLDKNKFLIKDKIKYFLENKKELMALAKGEYQSPDVEFSIYLHQKISNILNDAIDQYIILKKYNYLNNKELEHIMNPFEEISNDFYINVIGNSFEKEYSNRFSILKLTKKGVFYK